MPTDDHPVQPFVRRYLRGGQDLDWSWETCAPWHRGWLAGVRSVLLFLIDRHGAVAPDLEARIHACSGVRLLDLAAEIAVAPDRAAVERALADLPPAVAA